MKGRLSLTIEPRIVHRAKRVARERNTSLSAMVEDLLREAVAGRDEGNGEEASPAFSRRWAGKVKLAPKKGVRYERLAGKYGK